MRAGFGLCAGYDPDLFSEDSKGRWTELRNLAASGSVANEAEALLEYGKAVTTAAAPYTLVFKFNLGFFFSVRGGIEALEELIKWCHLNFPEIAVVVDCKVGDIGNTNKGWARGLFDLYGADGITINPYPGSEAMEPFLERTDKLCIPLVRTSNEGAGQQQDRLIVLNDDERELLNPFNQDRLGVAPAYQVNALCVRREWNMNGNVVAVAGATSPTEAGIIAEILGPDVHILAPGFGDQGGHIPDVVPLIVNNLDDEDAVHGVACNQSRGLVAGGLEEVANNAQGFDSEIRAAIASA
jgi:orotidine-5'-phosphate decarboxylase